MKCMASSIKPSRELQYIDGTPDFTFPQESAKPHTSIATIETIQSMGFSLIRSYIWRSNSPNLNPFDIVFLFGTRSKYS